VPEIGKRMRQEKRGKACGDGGKTKGKKGGESSHREGKRDKFSSGRSFRNQGLNFRRGGKEKGPCSGESRGSREEKESSREVYH